MSWQDYDAPEDHVAQVAYPYIQWIHGNPALKQVNKVLASGGWMLPTDQVGAIDGVQPVEVAHKNGASTEAYLVGELGLAVLATRFTWFFYRDGRVEYLREYADGARGKLQALALVKVVSEAEPLMVTLSGMASKAFSECLKRFRKEVLGAARALTKKPYPDYTFWMRIRAGEPTKVGTGNATSVVTPPTPAWDTALLKDQSKRSEYLSTLFVGPEVLAAAQAAWSAAQTWREVRRQEGAAPANGNGDEPPYGPPDDLPYTGEQEDEIPF
jgi:hypothetical protein